MRTLGRLKPRDFWRWIRADHLEDRFRNAVLNSGKDLPGEIEDGVDIGRMIEPADKDDIPPFVVTGPLALGSGMDIRQDPDVDRVAAFLVDHRFLDG